MAGWTGWDYALLAVAAYVAVNTLVRMMTRRRDQLLDDLSRSAKGKKGKAKSPPPADTRKDAA